MAGNDADLDYPECCAHCPHLRPVKATCDHELRQALVRELTADQTCSVYSDAKSTTMRELNDSLQR